MEITKDYKNKVLPNLKLYKPGKHQFKRCDTDLYKQISALEDNLQKYIFLRDLFNMSKDVFFGFLKLHMREFIPIIYTPTVGYAIKNYSKLVDRPLGCIIRYSMPPVNLLDVDEVITFH